MKFAMLIVHGDETVTPEDEAAAPDLDEWFAWAREKGAFVHGVRLLDPPEAKTLAQRRGEIASRNPAAYYGRLELRPVHSSTLDD